MQERHILISAATSMLIAIACGAFGAHGLKQILSTDMLAIWQTAVQYQVIHGLAMLGLVALSTRYDAKRLSQIALCFVVGTLIFSGSLYLLAITGIKWLGAITPIGGTAFLVGWFLMISLALKKDKF
ncbi:DUF423 domain-containing protein [Undibacterium cyanobacteriorum]|uniref:DUF423 domain-containing protein n=1 Tax=Undibacterium cyanobacteriorum TaxID=3073561 RepID=A0ABY9RIH4_9BURK|nr:DUF423 domain-containing protein [Undibacterium sp. 20NA77.5]WMW80972.1 DUF423 domain-containing protein [Undibacterium sp. 20NA77.5]